MSRRFNAVSLLLIGGVLGVGCGGGDASTSNVPVSVDAGSDAAPEAGVEAAAAEAQCADAVDNDLDGKVDCADPDCEERDCGYGCECRNGEKAEARCGDARDNDGDGKIDCLDPDC